jgi:hypothetical protein
LRTLAALVLSFVVWALDARAPKPHTEKEVKNVMPKPDVLPAPGPAIVPTPTPIPSTPSNKEPKVGALSPCPEPLNWTQSPLGIGPPYSRLVTVKLAGSKSFRMYTDPGLDELPESTDSTLRLSTSGTGSPITTTFINLPPESLRSSISIRLKSLYKVSVVCINREPEADLGAISPASAPKVQGDLLIAASLISPSDPAIVGENNSDSVAEGISWQLVMFRTTDLAVFSYVTTNMGYIKGHSKGAPHAMQLNSLPHAPAWGVEIPGGGQIIDGDNVIGTLSVDCALCKGITLVVSFIWGKSGWFYQTPNGNGRLLVPKEMTKAGITRFIEFLNDTSPIAERRFIQ